MKRRVLKPRNPMASELRSALFQKKVVPAKKGRAAPYKRKTVSYEPTKECER